MLILIAVVLGIYGGYSFWMGVATETWTYVLFGAISIIDCMGLIMKKQWAKYVLYFIAAGISGSLIYVNYYQFSIGAIKYPSNQEYFIALLPAIFILVICVGSSIVVHRKFGKET